MTKITGCFLILQVTVLSAFCQLQIKVEETVKTMSKGSQNAYVTEIPQAKLKEVTADWKKYVKNETKNNIESSNGEFIMRATMIPNISSNPITVYARILETEKNIRFTAFFTEDDSNFISSVTTEEKSLAAKKFLHDFAVKEFKIAVKHERDDENKKLTKLEDEFDDLIKADEKAHKRINEDNRQIDKNKNELIENRKSQEARSLEVANQKEEVRSFSLSGTVNGDEKDHAEKKLNELEKEKKKLEKRSEKLHQDNDDLQSDIKQQERFIEKNNDLQAGKKEEITLQKNVLKSVDKKAADIR